MSKILALSLSLLILVAAQGNRSNSLNLTETDKILLNLSTLERSVNEKNGDWFVAHFSPSYYDTNKTNLSQIKTILHDFLANVIPNEKVPLFYIDNPKVTIYHNFAGVTLKILINGRQIGKREPLLIKSDDRFIFRNENGWWKIIKAENLVKLLRKRG